MMLSYRKCSEKGSHHCCLCLPSQYTEVPGKDSDGSPSAAVGKGQQHLRDHWSSPLYFRLQGMISLFEQKTLLTQSGTARRWQMTVSRQCFAAQRKPRSSPTSLFPDFWTQLCIVALIR